MLETVDLSLKLENKEEYLEKLKNYQLKLLRLQGKLQAENRPLIIVLEGWDASGKGGNIRRFTQQLDPKGFHVYGISAPDDHEKKQHYLQRFWTKLPEKGKISVFDRSWYGRVLVERVEQFAKKKEWKRAYEEINQFEKLLTDDGFIMIKFWLHISKDEQLARFKDREKNPFKSWKITDEDWRNREKWDDYVEAVEEMFEKTNQFNAPWHVIPANNKWYARIKVIETIVKTIEENLKG